MFTNFPAVLAELKQNEFLISERMIGGELCYLVRPAHIGVKWNLANLIFRSSVWTYNGYPVSLGFRKFFNYGEHPELIAPPKNLQDSFILEKLDGSCLVVSSFNGEKIVRTRGTFDATQMLNGHEIELLKLIYPQAFDNMLLKDEKFSFIYEWVTPSNQIVIPYPKLDLYLLAIVKHLDYSYLPQNDVDNIASQYGLKRPTVYNFRTLEDTLETVKLFKGKEGVVLYYGNSQLLTKMKGDEYLYLHALKSQINLEYVLGWYLSQGQPGLEKALELLENLNFDYEIRAIFVPFLEKVCEADKKIKDLLEQIATFVNSIFAFTRKEQAGMVLKAYSEKLYSGVCFTLLDGRQVDKRTLEKLYWHFLEA